MAGRVSGRLRSPIKWFGGKGRMLDKLLPILERAPHTYYVEPFGGGASVLMAKKPVAVETYNDLDGALYEFFMTLANDEDFERFYRKVAVLPYSRRLYDECRAAWAGQSERFERVWRWYVVARMSFGGRFGAHWGSVVTASSRGRADTVGNWQSALDRLPRIHERLQRVQIENADALRIIERYDTPDTLFYLDPPYVHDTRRDTRYRHEMTDADHAALVDRLLCIQGRAALSGYDHPVYERLVNAGWDVLRWNTACSAAGHTRATGIQGEGASLRMQKRTEVLWCSPGVIAARQMRLFGEGVGM